MFTVIYVYLSFWPCMICFQKEENTYISFRIFSLQFIEPNRLWLFLIKKICSIHTILFLRFQCPNVIHYYQKSYFKKCKLWKQICKHNIWKSKQSVFFTTLYEQRLQKENWQQTHNSKKDKLWQMKMYCVYEKFFELCTLSLRILNYFAI